MRLLTLALLLAPGLAAAQSQSAEERLRELLRKTTVDLRAAQDGQAAAQAAATQATQQRDDLQKQLDELKAKAAETPAAPVPPPVDPELEKLRAQVTAQQAQIAGQQGEIAKWQAAYQQAAQIARAKDAEARDLGGKLRVSEGRLGIATTRNVKLVAIATDILHLYRTQSFRNLLVGSYEPLLGLKNVELQNIVQDNEDRILDQKIYGNEPLPEPAPAPSTPPKARK